MPDPATTPAHEGGEHRAKLVTAGIERQFECSCGFRTKVADWLNRSIFDIEEEFREHLRAALAGTSADAEARETVTVYVLNRAYDYEGECTIGVFATKEAAVAGARADAVDYGRDESPLVEIPGGSWAVNEGDSVQWVIRDFEVQSVTVTPGKERGK